MRSQRRDVRDIEIPDLVVEELWVILRISPPPDLQIAHFLEDAPRTAKGPSIWRWHPPDETACGEFVA